MFRHHPCIGIIRVQASPVYRHHPCKGITRVCFRRRRSRPKDSVEQEVPDVHELSSAHAALDDVYENVANSSRDTPHTQRSGKPSRKGNVRENVANSSRDTPDTQRSGKPSKKGNVREPKCKGFFPRFLCFFFFSFPFVIMSRLPICKVACNLNVRSGGLHELG